MGLILHNISEMELTLLKHIMKIHDQISECVFYQQTYHDAHCDCLMANTNLHISSSFYIFHKYVLLVKIMIVATTAYIGEPQVNHNISNSDH